VRCVAEMLGDGERRQPCSPARARRLVHLAEDKRGAPEHAGLSQLEQQFVTLTRALANAGEHRDAGVAFDRGADQLHDQHRLADPGAAEHRGLPACDKRRQQVDNLDSGVKNLARAALAVERRRLRVDRCALDMGRQIRAMVDRLPNRIEQTPEHRLANRCTDRCAQGANPGTAPEPGGAAKRHDPHHRRTQVLLHLSDERRAEIPIDRYSIGDRRQDSSRESDIDDRAMDRSYTAQGRIRLERRHRNRHSLQAHGSHCTIADSSTAALIQLNASSRSRA